MTFNPFWGYDGGGHIDYIFSLAKDNNFPVYGENDVAWHEPLYYFVMAAIAKIVFLFSDSTKTALHVLGLVQAFLSLEVTALLGYFFWRVSKNTWVALITTVFATTLPAFTKASAMLTNELLNYGFIILLLTYYVHLASLSVLTKKHALLLGAISGLALLTKITAIVPISIIFIFLLIQILKVQGARFAGFFLVLALIPILLMETPWQAYRATFLERQTINNPSLLTPQPIKLDARLHFYRKFDTDIFKFPYWYSGGRGFWSMFYADSFYDYDNILYNHDTLIATPESEKIRTTHNETFAPTRNYKLNRILVLTGVLPLLIILIGIARTIYKKDRLALFGLAITAGFLSALLYFSYRYPYYDMGIVKSIFIFPIFLFPLITGVQTIRRYLVGTLFLLTVLLCYTLPILISLWIPGSPY